MVLRHFVVLLETLWVQFHHRPDWPHFKGKHKECDSVTIDRFTRLGPPKSVFSAEVSSDWNRRDKGIQSDLDAATAASTRYLSESQVEELILAQPTLRKGWVYKIVRNDACDIPQFDSKQYLFLPVNNSQRSLTGKKRIAILDPEDQLFKIVTQMEGQLPVLYITFTNRCSAQAIIKTLKVVARVGIPI